MARPSVPRLVEGRGFCHVGFLVDPATYCPFSTMLDVCHKQGAAMVNDGVPRLPRQVGLLTDRVAIQKTAVFAWGSSAARRSRSTEIASRKHNADRG